MPAPELDPATARPTAPDASTATRTCARTPRSATPAPSRSSRATGRIDWWPIPDLDACPTFAALLDAAAAAGWSSPPSSPPPRPGATSPARTSWRPRTSRRRGRCGSPTRSTPASRAGCRGPSWPAGWTGWPAGSRCGSRSPRDLPERPRRLGARHGARRRPAGPRRGAGRAPARRGRDRRHRPGRARHVHRAGRGRDTSSPSRRRRTSRCT